MNSNRIQEVFNTIGKLLYIDQQGDTYADALKDAVVALEQQHVSASGSADPYNELQLFVGPSLTSVRPIVMALDRVGMVAKASVDNLLRVVASEVGCTMSDPPATILAGIRADMLSAGEDVAPSGSVWRYFFSNYGVQLPTDPNPSIEDTIITVSII